MLELELMLLLLPLLLLLLLLLPRLFVVIYNRFIKKKGAVRRIVLSSNWSGELHLSLPLISPLVPLPGIVVTACVCRYPRRVPPQS